VQEFYVRKEIFMTCNMSELNQIEGCAERVKFFEKCQEGGRAGAVVWQGWLVWPNGSNRELAGGNIGRLSDASWFDKSNPQEVKENLWFRIRFCQCKLEDSISIFESAKAEIKRRADDASVFGSAPPAVEEIKQLRRLKHICKQWQAKLNELDEILNPQSEPYVPSEQERKMMNKNRDEADSILNSLKVLEI